MLSWQNLHQEGTLAVPCTMWQSPHCWWHPIQIWGMQSSFEIDYLHIIIKDVNMGRNSITGGHPVWNWLPIIMKDANAPHPFLAQKIYLVQLLLLWTKTVATWQSSALPSAWITTSLSIAPWSSWEDGAHQEGSEENLSHCSQPSC